MPNSAFAFELYDVQVRRGKLEDGELVLDRKVINRSKRYYPDAAVWSLEDVKLNLPDSLLQSNMECNHWSQVIKTRCGNFQPFENAELI